MLLPRMKNGHRTHRWYDPRSGEPPIRVDALQFPTDPLGPTIERWENCSKQLNQLKGNAMSGARLCVERAVPMIARYTGTHTQDSFKVVGAVSQGTDETASVMRLGSGDLSIIGRRIGDCSS